MEDIELYGARTGNSFRAAIALAEAGVPYRVRLVDLRGGEQKSPEYLALNPRGQVPIVVTTASDSSRSVLTQSNAIMMYAAESAPGSLLPKLASRARYLALERYFYFVTDVIAPNHAAFALAAVAGSEESRMGLNDRSHRALKMAEAFLNDSDYMAGDCFTLADISAYTIALANPSVFEGAALPNLRGWFERIGRRSGVRRGLHAFD
jgi:GST-like protein